MGWRWFVATLAAVALFAPVASAQGDGAKCSEAVASARAQELDKIRSFAGAVHAPGFVYSVEGPNCRVITFYRMPANPTHPSTPEELRKLRYEMPFAGKTAPPFFAARYVDDSKAAPYMARWTDQARCPALMPVLEKLEAVLAPKLVGDGPYRYGSTAGISDQPRINFWMSDRVYPQGDPEFRLDYILQGGSSAPFGNWLFNTFEALAPCWSEDQPVMP